MTTIYPGAGPETVEREVTKKIEEAVNTVEGVKHIESISQEGLSNIVVEFQLEVSAINASQDVRGKIAAIRGELPREIEEPIVQRIDFGQMPIVSIGVDAPGLSPQAATDFADKVVKRRLENVRGVGLGRPRRRVEARDPGRGRPPEARGLPRLARPRWWTRCSARTSTSPAGTADRGATEALVRVAARGRTRRATSRRSRSSARAACGLRARRRAGDRRRRGAARTPRFLDERPALALDVQKQSGANTVAVARRRPRGGREDEGGAAARRVAAR